MVLEVVVQLPELDKQDTVYAAEPWTAESGL
jgi:hypothetical protein